MSLPTETNYTGQNYEGHNAAKEFRQHLSDQLRAAIDDDAKSPWQVGQDANVDPRLVKRVAEGEGVEQVDEVVAGQIASGLTTPLSIEELSAFSVGAE